MVLICLEYLLVKMDRSTEESASGHMPIGAYIQIYGKDKKDNVFGGNLLFTPGIS
jgi:hypothetical protein